MQNASHAESLARYYQLLTDTELGTSFLVTTSTGEFLSFDVSLGNNSASESD